MNQLGIRPAKEEENEWRRALFLGKGNGVLNSEIKKNYKTTFERMNISKPQLIIWYLMAQGETVIKEILSMTEEQRCAVLNEILVKLNKEYGRHKPIQ